MALKYKVGDRVKIKSLDWYNENKDKDGNVWTSGGQIPFDKCMSKWCGKVMTISHVRADHYTMVENLVGYWSDEMIERLVEEAKPKFKVGDIIAKAHLRFRIVKVECDRYIVEGTPGINLVVLFKDQDEYKLVTEKTKSEPKFNVGDVVYSQTWLCNVIIQEILSNGFYKVGDMLGFNWFTTHEDYLCKGNDYEKCGLIRNLTRCLFMDNCPHNKQKNIIEIPEDCVLKDENGNVINATKIVLEKKKKEYPKTYEECYQVTGLSKTSDIYGYKNGLLFEFQKLLIARDAYWKLYGEEMGLGKPWEPTDSDYITERYCIFVYKGNIICDTPAQDCILTFPTPEMRDAFYENFKVEIESCKEFL